MITAITVIVGIVMFIIGWQLSRRYMRWQIKRDQPAIVEDYSAAYKTAQEAMTWGWRAAKNGFSISYHWNEEGIWEAWFFKTMVYDKKEHAFYMRKYTINEGFVDITQGMPEEALHQVTIVAPQPEYLPDGGY